MDARSDEVAAKLLESFQESVLVTCKRLFSP